MAQSGAFYASHGAARLVGLGGTASLPKSCVADVARPLPQARSCR